MNCPDVAPTPTQTLTQTPTQTAARLSRLPKTRLPLAGLLLLGLPQFAVHSQPSAISSLDSAISRMGGAERLASLTSSRAEYMTMWQRTTWDSRPAADAPSFERHVDLRDYTTRRWRNTRYFVPGTMSIADVVNDTIGARTQPARTGGTETVPLNVTYVDERRELFAFAPERTLLLARAARDLRALPDTSIDGQRHRRVRATVEGFVATYYLRDADKLPARVHYRADATNDFGLAQWEVHDIDVW